VETGWHLLAIVIAFPPIARQVARDRRISGLATTFLLAGAAWHVGCWWWWERRGWLWLPVRWYR